MASPPPEVIELSSSSDDDDEDVKRAIALSLEEMAASAKSPTTAPKDEDFKSQRNEPRSSDALASSGMAAFGTMLLDRKKMEEERQARIAKRKRQEGGSSGDAPTARKPRVSYEASIQSPTGQDHKFTATANNPSSATPFSSPSPPFPKGVVKRTWTHGYERKGDDIKIEEIFQKEQLRLAVLASYQWDDDWLLSKIDISRTRLICIAYASDEAHKDQMRANVPSSHVRFCFPPMGGYGAMHAKVQILKFPEYVRVVVPSGNLTRYDWGETGVLENMVFLIDLPPLAEGASFIPTSFSTELFRFLRALGLEDRLVSTLEKYDFSETRRYGFVHTIAGSHSGEDWQNTGYSGLARTINDLGLASEAPIDVDFVCSSLGSLNREYLSSLYAAFQGNQNAESLIVRTSKNKPARDQGGLAHHFRVYFPSQKTVGGSRGGPASAGTITFRPEWWEASTFPRELLRDCVCRRRGLLVHSKAAFVRHGQSGPEPIGWVYVGSANLSESAWGRLVKDKSSGRPKMSCRNWECGVILPAHTPQTSPVTAAGTCSLDEVFGGHIPIPMVTPAAAYTSTGPEAQPWFFR